MSETFDTTQANVLRSVALPVHPKHSPDLARIFAEDGVVCVRDVLSTAELRELGRNIERYRRWMLGAVPHDWVRYEADGSVRGMYYMERVDPWFSEFSRREDLRDLVERITRKAARVSAIETFDKPARVGSPSLMHQDGTYYEGSSVRILNLWIAIDPVAVDNAAVQYWTGTQRGPLYPHHHIDTDPFLKTIAIELVRQLGRSRYAVLEPGSAVIHDDRVVHASAANRSARARRAIAVSYKLSDVASSSLARAGD